MKRTARQIMGIRPGEERLVRLASLLAFSALAMNVLVLATVTALFLGQRARSELPLAYGAAALFGLCAALTLTALSGRVARVREAGLVFLSLALVLTLAWAGLPFVSSSLLFVVYPLATGLAALGVVQAFAIVSDCVDAEQAKRLLPLIGSGGTLGAVFAGAAIALIAPRLGTRALLLLAASAALLAIWVAVLLVRSHVTERAQSLRPPQEPRRSPSHIVKMVDVFAASLRRDPLVYLFGLGQCAITVASTLLRFEFESTLQTRLNMDTIAVFLGVFNLGANASVLVVQTLFERAILRRFGLGAGLASVPLLFLLAMPLLWLGPALFVVAGARFAEHVLRFSIARTSDDLVLLPLPSTRRRHTKTLVAGALVPTAVLMTSGLLIAANQLPTALRAAIAFGCGGLALWSALAMRRPYLARLEGELSQPRLTLDSIGAPALLSSRASIAAALQQTLREADPRRVAFALTTLAETRIEIAPEHVDSLYRHADPQVREAAYLTAATTGDPGWLDSLFSAFANEPDAGARTACARALCSHLPEHRLAELEPLLSDPASSVRAEVLARRDPLGSLQHASLEVRRAALGVAQRTHDVALLPGVIAALGERPLSAAASDALRGWPCVEVVYALIEATGPGHPLALQRRAIRALGRVTHPAAQARLLSLLEAESEDTQTAALRSLVRQRRGGAVLSDLTRLVQRGARGELRVAQVSRLATERLAQASLPAGRSQHAERELCAWSSRCEARLFLWLALAYPPDEMRRAQLSLASEDRRARAFALEMLEQRLDLGLRRLVMDELGTLPADERRQRSERALCISATASVPDLLALTPQPVARWLLAYLAPDTYRPSPGEPSMAVLETMFVLRSVELFSRLSSEELRAVAELSQTRRVKAREAVFREGETGDAFYVIKAGDAHVEKQGKLLATLREGDWFGELALLDQGVRTASVIAHSELELTCISAQDFHDLLDEAPSIARAMLASLARRQARLLDSQPS